MLSTFIVKCFRCLSFGFLNCSEFGVLINSAFNLLDHNKGLSKKKLAGILVGCSMFIMVMIILGGVTILRVRRKKLEKPGNYLVI